MKQFSAIVLMIFLPQFTYGRVGIILDETPNSTPIDYAIFIVESFFDWQPIIHSFCLTKPIGWTYKINNEVVEDYFEYKFKRGSWIANREYKKSILLIPLDYQIQSIKQ